MRFANIAAGSGFRSADVYPAALQALGAKPTEYTLASFRYDLWKLRAKGLVEKIPHSRRYRLVGKVYAVCVLFLKLFERIYAPLTAGLLKPFPDDRKLVEENAAGWTVCISALSMIGMHCCVNLVSRPLPDPNIQREQNSRLGPHNGPNRGSSGPLPDGRGSESIR